MTDNAPIFVRPPRELVELVPEYIAISRAQLDDAMADNNVSALRTLGHNLRGSAASFGLDDLGLLGRELEECATREGSEDRTRACAVALSSYLSRIRVVSS